MLEFYPVYPVNDELNQTDFYWFEKGFSNIEIRNVLRVSKIYEFEEGKTQSEQQNGEKDENPIRKSNIKWMPPSAEKTEWIYEKLMQLSLRANLEYWKFDLNHIKDAIQYTEYNEDVEGKYDWHMDLGPFPHSTRKISITVQLSDPSEYEGGDLEFNMGGKIVTAPKGKGAVVCFPSYLLHRVTPVTKGVRKSLVLWVGGSVFK
jgi:PKHD-type hydroxylase